MHLFGMKIGFSIKVQWICKDILNSVARNILPNKIQSESILNFEFRFRLRETFGGNLAWSHHAHCSIVGKVSNSKLQRENLRKLCTISAY